MSIPTTRLFRLDGRDRLAACRRLGLVPDFLTYQGDHPGGYALSMNIARRHLSKGQRAMIAAKARLFAANNGLTQLAAAARAEVSRARMAFAEVVLKLAPDLADAVIAGGSLDDAYRIASERKARQQMLTEAAEMAEPPDLALLDLLLPGGPSGLDLVRALRRHPRTAAVRIALMSAGNFGEGLLAGVPHEAFVPKPFHIGDLAAAIARCLGGVAG